MFGWSPTLVDKWHLRIHRTGLLRCYLLHDPRGSKSDETSWSIAESLGLPREKITVSFQSRLGRLPWLQPYTDATLAELPQQGVEHLVVACPAFVADNLETLEEIGIAGRETFLNHGGKTFTLIPCLNSSPAWVEALADIVQTPISKLNVSEVT